VNTQPVRRQRVDSSAAVSTRNRRGRSVLAELDQRGGAKVRLPATPIDALDAVLINTAGGITGGDLVQWRCSAGRDTRLRVSTAASEKAYRSHGPSGQQRTHLQVGAGAHLSWLPQETIIFDGACLERRLEVELAADASCLICEALVFGRRAMGEYLSNAHVKDTWRVSRSASLLHAEALDIDAAIDLRRDGDAAGFGLKAELGAMATVLVCDPRGTRYLEQLASRVRAMESIEHNQAVGISVLPDRLVVRLLGEDAWELRKRLVPILTLLQDGDDVPRVWHV
jgi:urease accessory protein